MRKRINYPRLLCLLAVVLITLLCATTNLLRATTSKIYYSLYPDMISLHNEVRINGTSLFCYRYKGATLPDISEVEPKKGKSIFFHESSCRSYLADKIELTARQACAVESAALWNPDFEVYLLFVSPGVLKFENTTSDIYLQTIMSYDNVKLMHLDYKEYTKGTPVEALYASGKLERSKYSTAHSSDVLRFLTLWKYGGIYFDLDVITKRSFRDVPLNFAGMETETEIGSAVLSFSPDGEGHDYVESCLEDLGNNYQGEDWAYNGPGVITRLLQKLCSVERFKEGHKMDCQEFTIYPSEVFYPIPWWSWKQYLNEKQPEKIIHLTEKSYAVHFWNKFTSSAKISRADSKNPYAITARQNCPKVFEASDDFF